MKHLLRYTCLAAVLAAGSCTGPQDPGYRFPDGAANHPITVTPSYQAMKLYYDPADQGIAPTDRGRFAAFVTAYRDHGNGAIAVSAPAGLQAQAALSFFAGRINQMGIPKSKILVATHDASAADQRVEITYVAYQAHADKCGDWSDNLAVTLDNSTPKNFGCAVQHNIAAQVADPRDLVEPRTMESADATRRDDVIDKYEHGQITQANKNKMDKNNEQSGTSSDVTTQ